MSTARLDWLNIALIVLSCVCAHAFPWQTLLLAYAILGPAHYLTEISWLHDRRYFTHSAQQSMPQHRGAAGPFILPAMALLAMLLSLPAFGFSLPQPGFAAAVLMASLIFALATVAGWRPAGLGVLSACLVAIAVAGMAGASARAAGHAIVLAIAVLMPTVVHIFVFTAVFMLQGARRSAAGGISGYSGYVALGVLMLCAASFTVPALPGPVNGAAAALPGLEFFQPVVDLLGQWLGPSGQGAGQANENARLFGFLGFAYAYHYLNWFSKAELLRWHQVPLTRLIAIVAIWLVLLALYWLNFALGFFVSLWLSHLHVLLELPLNVMTFGALVRGNPVSRPGLSTPRQEQEPSGQ